MPRMDACNTLEDREDDVLTKLDGKTLKVSILPKVTYRIHEKHEKCITYTYMLPGHATRVKNPSRAYYYNDWRIHVYQRLNDVQKIRYFDDLMKISNLRPTYSWFFVSKSVFGMFKFSKLSFVQLLHAKKSILFRFLIGWGSTVLQSRTSINCILPNSIVWCPKSFRVFVNLTLLLPVYLSKVSTQLAQPYEMLLYWAQNQPEPANALVFFPALFP